MTAVPPGATAAANLRSGSQIVVMRATSQNQSIAEEGLALVSSSTMVHPQAHMLAIQKQEPSSCTDGTVSEMQPLQVPEPGHAFTQANSL